jgi:four helix bundle protein
VPDKPTNLRERMFDFVCNVVLFCRALSTEPGVVRQIAWQLADAATSAGSNLEEAKAAYSRRDFASKNSISLKEMRETLHWLRVIRRCGLAEEEALRPLIKEADELTAMLTAGMKRLHTVGIFFLTLATLVFVLSSKF